MSRCARSGPRSGRDMLRRIMSSLGATGPGVVSKVGDEGLRTTKLLLRRSRHTAP